MGKVVVFKPADVGIKDNYQSSVGTNYYRDQTTGELFKTSGNNVRTIIPEQYKTAKFICEDDSATGSDNDIYQVPAGKVFILCTANLDESNAAALAGLGSTARLRYSTNGGGSYKSLIRINGVGGSNFGKCLSIYPSALMVFDENTIFNVVSPSANLAAMACVMGYEIEKSEYLGVFNWNSESYFLFRILVVFLVFFAQISVFFI